MIGDFVLPLLSLRFVLVEAFVVVVNDDASCDKNIMDSFCPVRIIALVVVLPVVSNAYRTLRNGVTQPSLLPTGLPGGSLLDQLFFGPLFPFYDVLGLVDVWPDVVYQGAKEFCHAFGLHILRAFIHEETADLVQGPGVIEGGPLAIFLTRDLPGQHKSNSAW